MLDLGVPGVVNNYLALVILACTVLCGVSVVRFLFNSLALNILVGKNWVSSVATVVAPLSVRGAINELLLRKAVKGARFLPVHELKGSNGGEGPA